MNNEYGKTKTRFGPGAVREEQPVPFRLTQTTELERLKDRLLRELLEPVTGAGQNVLLRRAANDAAALAWTTGHPLLFLPLLLEEKARAAVRQNRRQQEIRRRSPNLMAEAA